MMYFKYFVIIIIMFVIYQKVVNTCIVYVFRCAKDKYVVIKYMLARNVCNHIESHSHEHNVSYAHSEKTSWFCSIRG